MRKRSIYLIALVLLTSIVSWGRHKMTTEVKKQEAQAKELSELLSRIAPLYANSWRVLRDYDANDTSNDTLLWSHDRSAQEAQALLEPFLENRTDWSALKETKEVTYQARVQRLPLAIDDAKDGYDLILSVLFNLGQAYPSLQPMIDAELPKALEEHLYPHALRLLEWQLDQASDLTAMRAIAEQARPHFGTSDEALVVQMYLIKFDADEQLAPLEKELFKKNDPQLDQKWMSTRLSIEERYEEQVLPNLAQNQYAQRIQEMAEECFTDRITTIKVKSLDVNTGAVTLEIHGILAGNSKITRTQAQRTSKREIKQYNIYSPTIIREELTDQLPQIGHYTYEATKAQDHRTTAGEVVRYEKLEVLMQYNYNFVILKTLSPVDGAALSGVKVTTINDRGDVEGTYMTDQQGLLQLALQAHGFRIRVEDPRLIEPRTYYVPRKELHGAKQRDQKGLTYYPDKPIYRRGQALHVGIVTHESKEGQHLLTPNTIGSISLIAQRDGGKDEVIEKLNFRTNASAVAELTFHLPEDQELRNFRLQSDLGSYHLEVLNYKLNHLAVVIDSIPSGYVAEQPLIIHGKTLDTNGHPIAARLSLTYEHNRRIEGESAADGTFTLVTPPLQERSAINPRIYWRGDLVEVHATDPIGNVAKESLYLTKQTTNLPLSARAAIESTSINKEDFTLTLRQQPFRQLPLGDLSPIQVRAELISTKGTITQLGLISPEGASHFSLPSLPSGEYTLRLSTTDRYGQQIEDTLERVYLYSESDRKLASDALLWAIPRKDQQGVLVGSALGGTITIIQNSKSNDKVLFATLPLKAGEVRSFELPTGFKGQVQLRAYHHEQSEVVYLTFNRPEETEPQVTLKGLDDLDNEPLLPRAQFTREIQLLDSQDRPLGNTPVLVTVIDKAVVEASGRPEFWRLLQMPVGDIFYGRGGPTPLFGMRAMSTMAKTENGVKEEVAISRDEAAPSDGRADSPVRRTNFAETAYFTALLETDANGRVLLNFPLPDTQTEYLLKLFTYTHDLESQEIFDRYFKVYNPVSIELTLPRYLTQGDMMEGYALLRNTAETPLEGAYKILADGKLLAQGSVTLPAGQSLTVPFRYKAPSGVDATKVLLEGELITNEASDAVQRELPLLTALSTYRVATPIMLHKGQTRYEGLLPKGELATADGLWLDFYISPLHVILSQLAHTYAERQPVAKLSIYEAIHQLAVYSELEEHLRSHPELLPELRESTDQLRAVAKEEQRAELNRQAPRQTSAQILADFYLFLTSEEERTQHLQALEHKILTYQYHDGGFRFDLNYPKASPWLTSYLLSSLSGDGQTVYSSQMKGALRSALTYLSQQLEDPKGWYHDAITYALIKARLGTQQEPLSEEIQKQLDEQAQLAHKEYQRYTSTSRLLHFAEYSSYYDSKETYREVLKFVEDRSRYTHHDREKLQLALYLHGSKDGAPLPPEVARFMLQLKQGTLWSSPFYIDAVTALLRTISPTAVSPNASLVINGTRHQLTATERATGRVSRHLKTPEQQLALEWEGVESDFIFGGASYEVAEPAELATPTGEKLKVRKEIFARRVSSEGKSELVRVTAEAPAKSGEQLVVRYFIQTAQDLSLIQLRDPRPAGAEPGYDFYGYKTSDRLWYSYERREDHDRIFIDYLTRGEHLLELEATANVDGSFSYGPAVIESYYAPEYVGNSTGGRLHITHHNNEEE
ncbi:MAG: alpha-2-macroglobulin family protein [Porphyromonas sp.]|nr:alpha-2-macroglobulin family protein [Porphyromonas sp.]